MQTNLTTLSIFKNYRIMKNEKRVSGFITKEQLLAILNLAKEEQITEKAASERILGYKHSCLYYYKNKYNIEKNFNYREYTRKYKINDDFFSEINTKTAYWAGFIAADGNISKSNNALTITLADSDCERLEQFLIDTDSNYKIIHFEKGGRSFCSIHTVSQKMADDLKKNFNIIPAKSLILEAPNINWNDKDSIDAYIIGLIDGDGTTGLQKKTRAQPGFYISIVGTYSVLNFVKSRFEEILQEEISNILNSEKGSGKNTYVLRVGDLKARKLFIHFYECAIQKMYRKWSEEKYKYCKNFKKKLPICRRKGVRIFNLDGNLIKIVDTLEEAKLYTGSSIGTISKLCNLDDNKHMSKGFMFSRTKDKMDPFMPTYSMNKKYINFLNKEQKALDAGEIDIEDNA